MAEFIFTKEKMVALGEGIGMILQKHITGEAPPTGKEILMLIDIGAANGCYLWTVGAWDGTNWCCSFDNLGYTVVEWYELPLRKKEEKEKEFFSQLNFEDFWNSKDLWGEEDNE
jgi:hypothetical protein